MSVHDVYASRDLSLSDPSFLCSGKVELSIHTAITEFADPSARASYVGTQSPLTHLERPRSIPSSVTLSSLESSRSAKVVGPKISSFLNGSILATPVTRLVLTSRNSIGMDGCLIPHARDSSILDFEQGMSWRSKILRRKGIIER